MKPLGRKAYGSIPHLPGSRLGPGDHHCSPGQAVIATEKPRDRHDIIIVQEKLDGSNVAAAKINDKIVALTRAGYLATTSPYAQHHRWEDYVRDNEQVFYRLLEEGERVCAEWMYVPHGTMYDTNRSPLVVFDLMTGSTRLPYEEFRQRVEPLGFTPPFPISVGPPVSIEQGLEWLGEFGFHGALEQVEGLIYRVERKGKVDFLCKYVRHDKIDGKYLEKRDGEKSQQ